MIANNGMYLGKRVSETPIMSFQTNKNGTFAPILTGLTGTLRWVVDGSEQITNSPSYSLTGSTVNVEVYANTVVEGEVITSATFNIMGIIGSVSLNYFLCSAATLNFDTNTGLTAILFRDAANTVSSMRAVNCSIDDFDFSKVVITGQCRINGNSATAISFKTGSTLNTFVGHTNSFTTVSFSGCTVNAALSLFNCPNLTSITSGSGGTVSFVQVQDDDLSTLDMGWLNVTGFIRHENNTSLSAITPPNTISSAFSSWIGSNCALAPPATDVDEIFSYLNTYFSSTTPTSDLDVQLQGGTNGSPTGGASNTDIVNLLSVFTAAGFTFTYNIN